MEPGKGIRWASPSGARRTASTLLGVTVALLAVNLVLGVRNRTYVGYDPGDNLYIVVTLAGTLVYLAIGRMIVSRQPSNVVGWLLIAIPVIGAVTLANGAYATSAFVVPHRSLPFGIWSAWIDRWLLVPTLFAFVPIFLFYPDGRLPSRRWRWVGWLTAGSLLVTTAAFALTPGRMTGAMAHLEHVRVINPLGIGSPGGAVQMITSLGGLAMVASAILACASIVARYRGSQAEVRQQIRWLALVGITFFILVGLSIVLALATNDNDLVGNVMFALMLVTLVLGIPFACAIAILRYHLYDLDIVVKKAVVFGLLTAFIAIVYAVIVAGVGTLIGSTSNPLLSFGAAATLAVAFQPVRERVRRIADRLVYGERASPYEVLSEFSDRVGEAYSTDDVLERMVDVLAGGTGAESASVWLSVSGTMRAAATSPSGTAAPAEIPRDAVEVRHRGDILGALSVRMPASDPMNPARTKLVEDLASQAGLVLRNVRLIEELRASRQRLVAARDDERRKLERNLHDGAQQQLVALSVQLTLARTMVRRDPVKTGEILDGLQATASGALEDLRDLARGIYPPLLVDRGLTAALEAQARKAAVPTVVESSDSGRYPPDIEATVYFCALEALNNVAKYADATAATIHLSRSKGSLAFEVQDDGRGFDATATTYGTGLRGMADRLDAVGGTFDVESRPGRGTVVAGRVPVPSTGGSGPT